MIFSDLCRSVAKTDILIRNPSAANKDSTWEKPNNPLRWSIMKTVGHPFDCNHGNHVAIGNGSLMEAEKIRVVRTGMVRRP